MVIIDYKFAETLTNNLSTPFTDTVDDLMQISR